jgi:NADPH:quinone reductase-like Zn-dependent oxidoreductase
VGQLAVQIAKHVQRAQVVAVCSERNAALVQGLGADVVLDYGKRDALEQARPQGPYRVVVDCVGSYSGAGCRALLSSGGRHVIVSGDSIGAVAQLLVPPFSSKAVLGQPDRKRLARVLDAVANGRVRVNIARRFPLADAEQAHALSRTGRVTGKLVLLPPVPPPSG